MKHDPIASGKRKPVNLSQVSEAAIRDAAKKERDRLWKEENREWAESVNRWVEQNGLPLERYRLF